MGDILAPIAIIIIFAFISAATLGWPLQTNRIQEKACRSACERRGTEYRSQYADVCNCKDGSHLRADRGRMFR